MEFSVQSSVFIPSHISNTTNVNDISIRPNLSYHDSFTVPIHYPIPIPVNSYDQKNNENNVQYQDQRDAYDKEVQYQAQRDAYDKEVKYQTLRDTHIKNYIQNNRNGVQCDTKRDTYIKEVHVQAYIQAKRQAYVKEFQNIPLWNMWKSPIFGPI